MLEHGSESVNTSTEAIERARQLALIIKERMSASTTAEVGLEVVEGSRSVALVDDVYDRRFHFAVLDKASGFLGLFKAYGAETLNELRPDLLAMTQHRLFHGLKVHQDHSEVERAWSYHLFAILPGEPTVRDQLPTLVDELVREHLLGQVGFSRLLLDDQVWAALREWQTGEFRPTTDGAAEVERFFAPLLLQTRRMARNRHRDFMSHWQAKLQQAVEAELRHPTNDGSLPDGPLANRPVGRAVERLGEELDVLSRVQPPELTGEGSEEHPFLLDSLCVRGLRRLTDETTLRFGSYLTVLYGKNGTGKSTVLEALELAWTGNSSRLKHSGEQNPVVLASRGSQLPANGVFGVLRLRQDQAVSELPVCIGGKRRKLPHETFFLSQESLGHYLNMDDVDRSSWMRSQLGLEADGIEERIDTVRTELKGRLVSGVGTWANLARPQARTEVWSKLLEGIGRRGRLVWGRRAAEWEDLLLLLQELSQRLDRDGVLGSRELPDRVQELIQLDKALAVAEAETHAGWENASLDLTQQLSLLEVARTKLKEQASAWKGWASHRPLVYQVITARKAWLDALDPEQVQDHHALERTSVLIEGVQGELVQLKNESLHLLTWQKHLRAILEGFASGERAQVAVEQLRGIPDRMQFSTLLPHDELLDQITSLFNADPVLKDVVRIALQRVTEALMANEKQLQTKQQELASHQRQHQKQLAPIEVADQRCRETAQNLMQMAWGLALVAVPEDVISLGQWEPLENTIALVGAAERLVGYLQDVGSQDWPELADFLGRFYEEGGLCQAVAEWELLRLHSQRIQATIAHLLVSLLDGEFGSVVREILWALTGEAWSQMPVFFEVDSPKKVSVQAEVGTASAVLNAAERHIFGLAWFFTAYLFVGRRYSAAVVIDDPFQYMDDLNMNAFIRMFDDVLRAIGAEQVVLGIHQQGARDMITAEVSGSLSNQNGHSSSQVVVAELRRTGDLTSTLRSDEARLREKYFPTDPVECLQ